MPVEWYTNPDVQTDDDWDISGPMPASWFRLPEELKSREFRMPEKPLTCHIGIKFLTVNGSDWTDLKAMVKDAVLCHFDDDELPAAIRLHLVKDEVMVV